MKKLRYGILILAILVLASLVLGGATSIDTRLRCVLPSPAHPAGFDGLGRDLVKLSFRGLGISLGISLSSAFLACVFGTILASVSSGKTLVSSFFRGLSNSMKVLPPVVLALLFVAIGGNGVGKVVAAVSIASAASVARTLSGVLSTLRGEDHIEAAHALGLRRSVVWKKHILPSLMPYVREHFASIALSAILTESSLSYLGLGVGPGMVTLGAIMADGKALVLSYPHVVVLPSALLLLLSLSLILVSRGLSEVDPSLQ